MTNSKTSKASDDPNDLSIKNAVDRASSKTPLESDEHIDPKATRDRVLRKQHAENARAPGAPNPPANPNVGPGPVEANASRSDEAASVPDTPQDYAEALERLPEKTAKQRL